MRKKKQQQFYEKVKDCTFQPILATKSNTNRGDHIENDGDGSNSINSSADDGSRGSSYVDPVELANRLYKANTHHLKKEMTIAQVKQEQEDALHAECTFKYENNSNNIRIIHFSM